MLLAISSSLHAVAITPAEPTGAVASLPRWRRPSLNLSQVGFRIALFEACSAFTSRYGLHLRQVAYQRPSTPKASTALLPPPLLRLLPAGATLTGRVSHPLKIAAFPRRTETDGLIGDGLDQYQAIVQAGVSRARPVFMAALTTMLGMLPLFQDAFFIAMAVTIVFGLGFATVLTLVVVPVLYAIFFKVPSPQSH